MITTIDYCTMRKFKRQSVDSWHKHKRKNVKPNVMPIM